jgi:hypothetical protein
VARPIRRLNGLVDEQQVLRTLRRMAEIVDRQNAGDPAYRSMAPGFDNLLLPQQEKARYVNGLIGQSLALWQVEAERTVSHKQLTPHLRFVGRIGISFSKRTTLRMRQRAPRPKCTRGS